jgi:hypothetical protein
MTFGEKQLVDCMMQLIDILNKFDCGSLDLACLRYFSSHTQHN